MANANGNFGEEMDTNPATQPQNNGQSSAELSKAAELAKTLSDLKQELDEVKQLKAQLKEKANIPAQTLTVEHIAAIAREVSKGMKDENPFELSDEPDDPEDFDEKGTTFFALQYYFQISDDIRKGKIVIPPRAGTNADRIVGFEFEAAKRVRNGRQEDVINISKFVSKSKKLTEWLRADSRYNKTFFENIPGNTISQGNAAYAKRMNQILSWARQQPAGVMAAKCQELGLMPTMDLDEMRGAVAQRMTEKEFRKDENGAYIPLSMNTQYHDNRFNEKMKEEMLSAREARNNVHERKDSVTMGAEMDKA